MADRTDADLTDDDRTADGGLAEHVAENRRHWDSDAPRWVAPGERLWAQAEPTWGEWGVPDDQVTLLPTDMTGLAAIELGCGTGYVSAWMVRRGARVVGIDNSEQQLRTARRLAGEHGVDVTWIHGDAEHVPYPDRSFDVAVSEYGAAIWCDPDAWIPEAHRLLRPGGTLAFLCNHPLAMICWPPDGSSPIRDTLQRDYFGLRRLDWRDAVEDPGGIEFNRPISDWFGLFDRTGFDVVRYDELQAPEGALPLSWGGGGADQARWAHRWPSEQVWTLRKR